MTYPNNPNRPFPPLRVEQEQPNMAMWFTGLIAIAVVLGAVLWALSGPSTNTASKLTKETTGSATSMDQPRPPRFEPDQLNTPAGKVPTAPFPPAPAPK